jgi:hypothetical protein
MYLFPLSIIDKNLYSFFIVQLEIFELILLNMYFLYSCYYGINRNWLWEM